MASKKILSIFVVNTRAKFILLKSKMVASRNISGFVLCLRKTAPLVTTIVQLLAIILMNPQLWELRTWKVSVEGL